MTLFAYGPVCCILYHFHSRICLDYERIDTGSLSNNLLSDTYHSKIVKISLEKFYFTVLVRVFLYLEDTVRRTILSKLAVCSIAVLTACGHHFIIHTGTLYNQSLHVIICSLSIHYI